MVKRVSVLSVALLLSCLVLSPQALRADTITFIDTSNTITVVHDGSQHTVDLYNTQTSSFGSCSADESYQCDIFISSPSGATPNGPTMSLNVIEPGGNPAAVSDTLYANPGATNYLVIFASDPPNDPNGVLGLTPAPGHLRSPKPATFRQLSR